MATYQYVLREQDDGAYIGATTSSKLGFYGTTPCDQPASANQAAVTTSVTTTATTTNLAATIVDIITLINQTRTDLVEVGLQKGSA